mmetsp:Transcript_77274/g.223605  ORF Transcript_77274/g.223605 Transcript_77274/m.223605 type:complete len:317 (+) Transcript_77274:444-1394(+)
MPTPLNSCSTTCTSSALASEAWCKRRARIARGSSRQPTRLMSDTFRSHAEGGRTRSQSASESDGLTLRPSPTSKSPSELNVSADPFDDVDIAASSSSSSSSSFSLSSFWSPAVSPPPKPTAAKRPLKSLLATSALALPSWAANSQSKAQSLVDSLDNLDSFGSCSWSSKLLGAATQSKPTTMLFPRPKKSDPPSWAPRLAMMSRRPGRRAARNMPPSATCSTVRPASEGIKERAVSTPCACVTRRKLLPAAEHSWRCFRKAPATRAPASRRLSGHIGASLGNKRHWTPCRVQSSSAQSKGLVGGAAGSQQPMMSGP